jgi:phosphoglycolate phosphatase-like HAD superfamily hydrolase
VVSAPLVVGFDLDMTLIDTRPGFAACLVALGEERGVEFDVDGLVSRLGPPLDVMLAPYFPGCDQRFLDGLVDRFRELYPEIAVPPTQAFPGAHEALEAVREHRGSSLVITGKYEPNARLHTDALGFDVDRIVGSVWGPGKGPVLVEHGASVYVGDHVHDVEGALAAGVHSVSVLTGGCDEAELRDAGTHTVLTDLTEFPQWLSEHVYARC